MRKINNLLELWKFKCEICNRPENKKYNKKENWADWIKREATVADEIIFALERMRSEEEFSTQILCYLFNSDKIFQTAFLKELMGEEAENRKKLTAIAEYPATAENHYDISLWEDWNREERKGKLICIVENKITAGFQPKQLERYRKDLLKNRGTLVTLTKYNVSQDDQVTKENKQAEASGVKFKELSWSKVIDLLEKYNENSDIAQYALDLFKSDYFLLHESGCACAKQEKSIKIEFFIDRISKNFPERTIHQGSKLKHRHIVLLPPGIEKKIEWCGGFMALSLWFDCYAVTGRETKDSEAPVQVKNNAVPFFNVVLRCYYTIDGKTSEEYDEKVKTLETAGYIRCKVFADEQQKKIKHEYLCKSLASDLRISDEETLEKEINNTDSEFWKLLTDEISAWKKIVCD